MNSPRTAVISLVLSTALALGACGGSTATDSQLELRPVAEIEKIVTTAADDLVVLDIRTPGEFATGHLPGAINIDYYADDFEDQLAGLDRDVPYVMYCNSGNRSANALPIMDRLGFQEVNELDGGIQAWLAAGFPTE